MQITSDCQNLHHRLLHTIVSFQFQYTPAVSPAFLLLHSHLHATSDQQALTIVSHRIFHFLLSFKQSSPLQSITGHAKLSRVISVETRPVPFLMMHIINSGPQLEKNSAPNQPYSHSHTLHHPPHHVHLSGPSLSQPAVQ